MRQSRRPLPRLNFYYDCGNTEVHVRHWNGARADPRNVTFLHRHLSRYYESGEPERALSVHRVSRNDRGPPAAPDPFGAVFLPHAPPLSATAVMLSAGLITYNGNEARAASKERVGSSVKILIRGRSVVCQADIRAYADKSECRIKHSRTGVRGCAGTPCVHVRHAGQIAAA